LVERFSKSERRHFMPTTSTISRDDLIALACGTAEAHQLDAALVCAICEQESAWNPWAIRYEPAFFAHYVAPRLNAGKISNTEAQARAFSWGLMQVMGQVAREHNFGSAPNPNSSAPPQLHSPYGPVGAPLAQLCDPATGLAVGCAVFAAKLSAAQGDATRALQLWNGGGNPNYAEEVLARVGKYQPTEASAAPPT
jgi:soluble lytic murein transglycosylase-like protein